MSNTIKLLEDDSSADRVISGVRELLDSASDAFDFVGGKRLSTIITSVGVGVSVFNLGRSAYNWYKEMYEKDEFYVKITDDSPLFSLAESWLMEVLPENDQKSIISKSQVVISDVGKKSVRMETSIDGTVKQDVTIGGHKVVMSTESIDTKTSKRTSRPREEHDNMGRVIQFACKTSEARKAVMGELTYRSTNSVDNTPKLLRSRSWGEFSFSSLLSNRPKDSVILKEGQMDKIMKFLSDFKSNEVEYTRMGLPYHTGILLHGLPGSGKTSTAMAIASEMEMDVYFVSLSSLQDDDSLYSCMEDVRPHSIVIFEDIDVAKSSKARDDEGTGVTMSGLLNSIDGPLTPHGAVFIMTTNHIGDLDDAVIRTGRVDLEMEIGAVDSYQFRRVCEYYMGFVPEGLPQISPDMGITTSDMVSIFKDFIPNYQDATQALIDLVSVGDHMDEDVEDRLLKAVR